MILTVNLGNTHITIGGYEHDDLKFCGRLHTDPAATVDEYGLRLLNLLSLHGASPEQIEGGILGSVVPALTGRVLAALQMLCPVRILTVGPGLKSGIRLRLDNPAQLGAELLCGAVAALAEGSGPLVVISADTAISLMAVNEKQELVGGVILPGPQLSLAALVQNTAQLPQIDLSAPAPASVLGKNTAACLQNGFVLGTAGMLDGLADHFCAELGPETKFYATGNLPTAIRDACRTPILYRETLITDGLYCMPRFLQGGPVWKLNEKICFLDGGRGAPQAVDTIETLAVLGVKRVVTVGMCGGFSEQVAVGDILVPDKAFVEEGTSLHYYEQIDFARPDEQLFEQLQNIPEAKVLPIVTTDAVYRQTFYKEQLWREKGAVAVDMETSALWSVGKFLGLQVASVLMISDRHPLREGEPAWEWKMTMEMRRRLFKRVMEIVFSA